MWDFAKVSRSEVLIHRSKEKDPVGLQWNINLKLGFINPIKSYRLTGIFARCSGIGFGKIVQKAIDNLFAHMWHDDDMGV